MHHSSHDLQWLENKFVYETHAPRKNVKKKSQKKWYKEDFHSTFSRWHPEDLHFYHFSIFFFWQKKDEK